MATPHPSMRLLARLKPLLRHTRTCRQQQRSLSSVSEDIWSHKPAPGYASLSTSTLPVSPPPTPNLALWTTLMRAISKPRKPSKPILTPEPLPSITKTCPDPIAAITASQLALLDPSGARTRLFAKTNQEGARVGDVLLVRLRNGDPFAGVCINIRRRGVDTAILLRGQLTRVGVEMWYKVYSPNVEGIEVVQRSRKRARRARLYYMRKPKHDRGSVENVVRQYMKTRAALGAGTGKRKDGDSKKLGKGKKK
ncbi:hypothetical protein K432DRAFT_65111 [Lepidopterella palustris CBS 459.81]|uniref:Ribosomal protein L19 n=1 Tax=Lepidopterella palustris CBS 459.81 TaxID=1314670 RepID=A0A8E2DW98_9PEZI|nr:hypothetical protein K432DRAFT_65111 [Lepidopterella palustris CBS 459.81]